MKIYLIRHAEKESEGENPPLTKRGIKQAKYLAKRLSKEKFDKFYRSDMERTKQTSEAISKRIKMKPIVEKSLNEYESSDIKQDFSKWNVSEKKRVKELYKFLDNLTKNKNKDEKILIVAHGITNRIIVASLLDMDLKKMVRMRQYETSINELKWSDKWKNWQLVKWNDVGHIPNKMAKELQRGLK